MKTGRFFLIFICIISILSAPVSLIEARAAEFDDNALEAYLYKSLQNCTEIIDVSTYKIPYSEASINKLHNIIYNKYPELFHIEKYSYNYKDTISRLIITYNRNKQQYDYDLARCENVANYMLKGLKNSNLSAVEKALIVHDRIVVYADYKVTEGNDKNEITGILLSGSGTCMGYANTYAYLLNKLSIPCYSVESKALNHVWNMITVNGTKFNVDVTYDDSQPDTYGKVNHDYFLKSSAYFKIYEHTAFDYDSSAASTYYDKAYWNNSQTEFRLHNGKIYYIDNVNSTLNVINNGASVVLIKIPVDWNRYYSNLNNKKQASSYSRLSGDSGNLYYSTGRGIYSFNPDNNSQKLIYKPNLKQGYRIFGFKAYNGSFYIEALDSPNFTSSVRSNAIVYAYSVSDFADNLTTIGSSSKKTTTETATGNVTENKSETISESSAVSSISSEKNSVKESETSEIKTESTSAESQKTESVVQSDKNVTKSDVSNKTNKNSNKKTALLMVIMSVTAIAVIITKKRK